MSADREFLVSMTTTVPAGTTDDEVAAMRAREAARSRELATQGQLLRLFRPPLQPGEWRTLGLFAAADNNDLETVLVSMPLRVWRQDDVTALEKHPNDPDPPVPRAPDAAEFLTYFTPRVPPDAPARTVSDRYQQERARTRDLAAAGTLERLWTIPADGRSLGLWQPDEADQMQPILDALPLNGWLDVCTVPLTAHPSDPALAVNQ